MPILNKPAFVKGSANEITLNKADLASEVSDLYFQDSANWKQVVLFYETSEGKQRKVLVYDASQGTPAANFNISERARDEWQIKRVAFYDFDGGSLTINRGDLTVAEFDIVLSGIVYIFRRLFDSLESEQGVESLGTTTTLNVDESRLELIVANETQGNVDAAWYSLNFSPTGLSLASVNPGQKVRLTIVGEVISLPNDSSISMYIENYFLDDVPPIAEEVVSLTQVGAFEFVYETDSLVDVPSAIQDIYIELFHAESGQEGEVYIYDINWRSI